MGDNAGQPLEELFELFAKFGDTRKSGDNITLKNIDKWLNQANLMNNKYVSCADTAVCFSKMAKTKKTINYIEFLNFLDELALYCRLNVDDIKSRLRRSGPPSLNNPTMYESKPIYDRLTDSTKYTGIHKKRFPAPHSKPENKN